MDNATKTAVDAALSNLCNNLSVYYKGDPYAYLPVAGELRKLTCDTKRGRDSSLVLRIDPHIRFNALRAEQRHFDEKTIFLLPATIAMGRRNHGKVSNLFNFRKELPLEAWRNQALLNSAITIRDLIRSVADKEAQHSDPQLNDTLKLSKSIHLGGTARVDSEFIAAIGHYITEELVVRGLEARSASDLRTYYNEQRAKLGPGALRCSLEVCHCPYSGNIHVGYITTAEVSEIRGFETQELRKKAIDLMETYRKPTRCLLWVDHLAPGMTLRQFPSIRSD
jgi:hypothetical protein